MNITMIGHASVLVEGRSTSILVDPWLTDRLDRFWVHWPPVPDTHIRRVDAILLSHHHSDHHHYPSLAKLDRDAQVHYPAGETNPRFPGSGMGHKAIGWTLRYLGFSKTRTVKPFETFDIGEFTITALPSKVSFPELSFLIQGPDGTVLLCGDSFLHEDTTAFLAKGHAQIDVAFIPVHSISPPEPLMQRRWAAAPEKLVQQAQANFETYVRAVSPRLVVPAAFGWKVEASGQDDFSWCNSTMFPLRPDEAANLARDWGYKTALLLPGDRLGLRSTSVQVNLARCSDRDTLLRQIYGPLSYNPVTTVPPFQPGTYGERQPSLSKVQLMDRLVDALVGTEAWYSCLDRDVVYRVRLSDADGTAEFQIDFDRDAPWREVDFAAAEVPTSLHSGTLESLLEGDLLIGQSYGLWTSRDNLLTTAFHQPSFYVEHLRRNYVG